MPDRGSEIVGVSYFGYIVAQTDRAIGLASDVMETVEIWLPKSQVWDVHYNEGEHHSQRDKGGEQYAEDTELLCLEIPAWLAQEHDLDIDDDWAN